MEKERQPHFTIEEMSADDIEEETQMRLQSWLDTYVNEAAGVTREWIEERNARHLSPEKVASRRKRFEDNYTNGTLHAWVARDEDGAIIGSTTPFIEDDDTQRLGSLYIAKEWHGTGVGSALMQKAIDWFDPAKPIRLGVAAYNNRAKAFYRKWGFEEVPESEELFDDRIPGVQMIRKVTK